MTSRSSATAERRLTGIELLRLCQILAREAANCQREFERAVRREARAVELGRALAGQLRDCDYEGGALEASASRRYWLDELEAVANLFGKVSRGQHDFTELVNAVSRGVRT